MQLEFSIGFALFVFSLAYGIPCLILYMHLIYSPIWKKSRPLDTYTKILLFYGSACILTWFFVLFLERLPWIFISNDNFISNLNDTHPLLLTIVHYLRDNCITSAFLMGAYMLVYRASAVLFPNTFDKYFRYFSVSGIVPSLLIPFICDIEKLTNPLEGEVEYEWVNRQFYVFVYPQNSRDIPLFSIGIVCVLIAISAQLIMARKIGLKNGKSMDTVVLGRGFITVICPIMPLFFRFLTSGCTSDDVIWLLLRPFAYDFFVFLQIWVQLIYSKRVRKSILQLISCGRKTPGGKPHFLFTVISVKQGHSYRTC